MQPDRVEVNSVEAVLRIDVKIITLFFILCVGAVSIAWGAADVSSEESSANEQNNSSVMQAFTSREVKNSDIVTNGGRVLGVTALGKTVTDAKTRAYEAVDKIKFDGAYCRRDIADKAIIRIST